MSSPSSPAPSVAPPPLIPIASTMPTNVSLAQQQAQAQSLQGLTPDTVSQQIMEHVMAELVHYCVNSTRPDSSNAHDTAVGVSSSSNNSTTTSTTDPHQLAVVAAEMSAAKLERIGYQIGYRLTERLAQTKTWNAVSTAAGMDAAQQTAAQQLEAVKFLCKEVWVQVFGKQIDKLQTNHRGVFVLKDLELTWLLKFPQDSEHSRVLALQWLALPCGLIRGCLADLGIPSVVSCDFLADGQHMAACSFNVKVK